MVFFSNLSIRSKHLLILALVVTGLIVTAIFSVNRLSHLESLRKITLILQQVNSDFSQLQQIEKNFLLYKQAADIDNFRASEDQLEMSLESLHATLADNNLDATLVRPVTEEIQDYRALFDELTTTQTDVGLTPKTGLYGSLRNAVHEVETLAKAQQEYELLFHMLMLRRNEKDFMLRRDMKYLSKFDANIAKFNQTLSALFLVSEPEIRQKLDNYQRDFKALVTKEQQIGLTNSDGILGRLRNQSEKSKATLKRFDEVINATISAEVSQASSTLMALIIAIILIVAISILLVSRAIYLPVSKITEKIHRIASTLDLSTPLRFSSRDEVGSLAKSFDSLMGSLKETITQVHDTSDHLSDCSSELVTMTHNVGSASEQQQHEIEQAVIAINQMTETISSIADNANLASEAVGKVSGEINRGKETAGAARNEISLLNNEVYEASQAIEELQKNSENIGEILSTISSIAEQTNLLALNAAIEAARAGEQGRGFAVVADEVRTLASRTQESTESIRDNIAQFKRGTEEVVKTVLSSRERAQSGITKVEESGSILDAISESIQNINEMNAQVATASKEQGTASEEIHRNIAAVNELSHQCIAQAHSADSTSRNLKSLGNELRTLVNKFTL
jgi:methyl-accepting chemotaxis protein